MLRTKWKLILGLVVVAAVALAAIEYGFNNSAQANRGGPRYKEFVVKRGKFRVEVSATGVVRPIDRVEIKSKASGEIDALPIEEGDFVHAGDLICRLDKTDAQADFDQARADLDIAEA
ncbi:MAG: efflux RND transporter periplasmic adaptor subunit, partial [Candidatus Zixiibacteriota bacterium]